MACTSLSMVVCADFFLIRADKHIIITAWWPLPPLQVRSYLRSLVGIYNFVFLKQ